MTMAQHTEARLESMIDGGGAGVGSRQNFGSVTAQGKKNSSIRVKGPQMTSSARLY
jgi:hypothetical protein